MTDALLTPDQAAEIIGVPRARVLELVRGRAIGAVRVGPQPSMAPWFGLVGCAGALSALVVRLHG